MNLTTDISAVNLVINRMAKSTYDHLLSSHQIHEDELYCVDEQNLDAKNQTIQNVADPTFPTDAVNRKYLSASAEISHQVHQAMTKIVTWEKVQEAE